MMRREVLPLRRSPTRRGFLAMLGAAAAIAAVRDRSYEIIIEEDDLPPRPSTGATRWIGHG